MGVTWSYQEVEACTVRGCDQCGVGITIAHNEVKDKGLDSSFDCSRCVDCSCPVFLCVNHAISTKLVDKEVAQLVKELVSVGVLCESQQLQEQTNAIAVILMCVHEVAHCCNEGGLRQIAEIAKKKAEEADEGDDEGDEGDEDEDVPVPAPPAAPA